MNGFLVSVNTSSLNDSDIRGLTAAAGFSANWEIDGTGITEEWVGGSAPTAGGSDGYDIYTANVLKIGDVDWKVFINLVNAT